MSFCTLSNANLVFTLPQGWKGQISARFRGAEIVRSVIINYATGGGEILKRWTSCEHNNADPEEIQSGIWDHHIIPTDNEPNIYEIQLRYRQDSCGVYLIGSLPFPTAIEKMAVEVPTSKLSQWEFHNQNGSYVDVIVVLEDDGGGEG